MPDKIENLGQTKEHPLHIHTFYRYTVDVPLWVTSDRPLHVAGFRKEKQENGYVINGAGSPIEITPKPLRIMHIIADGPLAPAFRTYWEEKLPHELKMEIMSYLVQLQYHSDEDEEGHESLLHSVDRWDFRQLDHYLQMTPNIAALATETFCRENWVRLGFEQRLMIPPLHVGKFIRMVEYQIICGGRGRNNSGWTNSGWTELVKLSRGGLNIPNLKKLFVLVNLRRFKDSFRVTHEKAMKELVDRMLPGHIHFECQGKICFKDRYDVDSIITQIEKRPRGDREIGQRLIDYIRNKVTFAETSHSIQKALLNQPSSAKRGGHC